MGDGRPQEDTGETPLHEPAQASLVYGRDGFDRLADVV
jgi:hypothetical protein